MASILTNQGRTKLLAATPLAPVTLSSIAFGDGGGSIPSVVATRTSLVNEVIRVDCSFPYRDTIDPTVIAVSGSIPRTFGGVTLREVGLYDNAGVLIAYGSIQNEALAPVTSDYGFTYTATFRVRLDNTTMVSVVNSDAPAFDHRGLTFRDQPDAHPASAITFSSGRTLEQMFSVTKVISANGILVVGENNILSTNSTQTLPSTSGLATGSTVKVAKYTNVLATIQVNNTSTEQIRVGGNTAEAQEFDSLLFDDIAEFKFVWSGTKWECYF